MEFVQQDQVGRIEPESEFLKGVFPGLEAGLPAGSTGLFPLQGILSGAGPDIAGPAGLRHRLEEEIPVKGQAVPHGLHLQQVVALFGVGVLQQGGGHGIEGDFHPRKAHIGHGEPVAVCNLGRIVPAQFPHQLLAVCVQDPLVVAQVVHIEGPALRLRALIELPDHLQGHIGFPHARLVRRGVAAAVFQRIRDLAGGSKLVFLQLFKNLAPPGFGPGDIRGRCRRQLGSQVRPELFDYPQHLIQPAGLPGGDQPADLPVVGKDLFRGNFAFQELVRIAFFHEFPEGVLCCPMQFPLRGGGAVPLGEDPPGEAAVPR